MVLQLVVRQELPQVVLLLGVELVLDRVTPAPLKRIPLHFPILLILALPIMVSRSVIPAVQTATPLAALPIFTVLPITVADVIPPVVRLDLAALVAN